MWVCQTNTPHHIKAVSFDLDARQRILPFLSSHTTSHRRPLSHLAAATHPPTHRPIRRPLPPPSSEQDAHGAPRSPTALKNTPSPAGHRSRTPDWWTPATDQVVLHPCCALSPPHPIRRCTGRPPRRRPRVPEEPSSSTSSSTPPDLISSHLIWTWTW